MRFSTLGFFHESVSKPLSIFSKNHIARCSTCVVDNGGKWKKSSMKKVLIILFGHLWMVPIICHRCHWHRWQIYCGFHWYCSSNSPLESLTGGVVDTHDKFVTRCSCNQCQICHWCRWYWWCTWTCEYCTYLRKFSTKFEMTLLSFSGTWGKMIHEKKPEAMFMLLVKSLKVVCYFSSFWCCKLYCT